jgi:hypothetical protein
MAWVCYKITWHALVLRWVYEVSVDPLEFIVLQSSINVRTWVVWVFSRVVFLKMQKILDTNCERNGRTQITGCGICYSKPTFQCSGRNKSEGRVRLIERYWRKSWSSLVCCSRLYITNCLVTLDCALQHKEWLAFAATRVGLQHNFFLNFIGVWRWCITMSSFSGLCPSV